MVNAQYNAVSGEVICFLALVVFLTEPPPQTMDEHLHFHVTFTNRV